MSYKYKTKPFGHQHRAFTEYGNWPGHGLLFDQGLGKTKILIDTACYLYEQVKIDAVVIIAPNDVCRNWATDEIPAHMPDRVQAQCRMLVWESSKAGKNGTKRFKSEADRLLEYGGLSILIAGYESSITVAFKAYMKRLFAKRKAAMFLDESHRIKGSSSKAKTTLVAMGKHALYRRIATGTPMEQPFDIWPQLRFLDQDFWARNGFATFESFKQRYGVYTTQYGRGRSWEQLVAHRNLDELSEIIKQITWRLEKHNTLDLPPKTYAKRYFEMTPAQRRAYDELKNNDLTRLLSGDELSADAAIVKMLRLQQIACGYVACEAEQPSQQVDPDKNVRMDLVCAAVAERTEPSIIFHRFQADIEEMVRRLGNECVRFDGSVSSDDRVRARQAFQAGDKKYLVGSKAAFIGLTLTAAKFVDYYSNSFSLTDRLQSEDRAHRIGQTGTVVYTDWMATDTIDEYIVKRLRGKKDVFETVLQDEVKAWI